MARKNAKSLLKEEREREESSSSVAIEVLIRKTCLVFSSEGNKGLEELTSFASE